VRSVGPKVGRCRSKGLHNIRGNIARLDDKVESEGGAAIGNPLRSSRLCRSVIFVLSRIMRVSSSCHEDNVMNHLFPLTLAALCLTAPAAAQITSFQHIILVIQENRTLDDMLQRLCTNPSASSA